METCQDPFAYPESPLGNRLMLNQFNVKEGKWEPRQFDSLSNALLINHNIWIHWNAFARANHLFAQADTARIPVEYVQCIELVKSLFACSDAVSASYEMEKHLTLLDRIAPTLMATQTPPLIATSKSPT